MENNAPFLAPVRNYEFDPGNEYKWFVYFDQANAVRKYASDSENLSVLQSLAGKYTPERIYRDFVKLYDVTESNFNPNALNTIAVIAESYGDDAAEINYLFSIMYFGMLSEQHKKDAKLGKRIKRLAVYQALFDTYKAEGPSYYPSRKWWLLDSLCSQRGF